MSPLSDRALREITRQWRLDAYGSLLIAVILQAVEDARPITKPKPAGKEAAKNWIERVQWQQQASFWLEDRCYVWICEATGVSYNAIDALVEAMLA